MRTIRLESTDSDNISTSTTVIIDFENSRSVEQGFVHIVNFLERLGLELPEDAQALMQATKPVKKQFLRG